MFVHFSLFFLLISTSVSTIIRIPVGKFSPNDDSIFESVKSVHNLTSPWLEHIRDFLNLIDGDTMLGTVVRFIDDPEVMRFVGFLLSPKFKEIIWEMEVMDEFQEAYTYLKEKGFDMQSVIDAINSVINLPPFKPLPSLRYDKGVSGFIAAVIGTLPFEDIKELFKHKLENCPEFEKLIEVMHSEKMIDILKRMLRNPKISEFKTVLEDYGVDFKFICEILNEVFGTHYSGIFCPKIEGSSVKTVSLM